MTWNSFEELTSSDIATNYFQTLLELIKENPSPILYCHLKEDVLRVPIPGIIVDEASSRVTRSKIELPLSADLTFRVNDGEKEIGNVNLGHISHKLDDDNKFVGYDEHIKIMLNHQAGLRLRHLMPLNRSLFFKSDFGVAGYVAVEEGLIESLISPHYAQTLDTLTLEALESSD